MWSRSLVRSANMLLAVAICVLLGRQLRWRSIEAIAESRRPRRELSDLKRMGEIDCCRYDVIKGRLDLLQKGICKQDNEKYSLHSHGWGVDLMVNTGGKIGETSFMHSKPFSIITQNKEWHYAKDVCPQQNLECYFKKVAPTIHHPKNENCTEVSELPPIPENCCERDETTKTHLSYYGYEYLTQLNDKYLDLTLKRAEGLRIPEGKDCAVLHVRRSDTLLNKGWGGTGPAQYKIVPLTEYMDNSRMYLEYRNITNLIIMTDSSVAIDETKQFTNYTWHYLDRKRFKGSEGGWENHFPSGDRSKEVVDILALLYATRQCSVFVGSRSRFGIMHYRGMSIYQKDPWYIYIETRVNKSASTDALEYAINHRSRLNKSLASLSKQ